LIIGSISSKPPDSPDAIAEGSGVMAGAVALAASGVTFGLLGIAMALMLNR